MIEPLLTIKLAVAPHAGAWVETCVTFIFVERRLSRPMRARGLKLSVAIISVFILRRAPCGRVG